MEQRVTGENVGWFEFYKPDVMTTHIAYVYEDGSVYLPEGLDVVDEVDFTLANARGLVYRLVRADDVSPDPSGPSAPDGDPSRT